MNAAVRAAARAALAHGWEGYWVRNGYAGLLADNMGPLRARDLGGIIQRGVRGVLVGVIGREIVATPLADVAGRIRRIDVGLLDLARVLAQ